MKKNPPQSSANSSNLDGPCEVHLANVLKTTKLDRIMSYGLWITAGHVEMGGDDFFTHVPVEQKLTVIATRGIQSCNLKATFTSVKTVLGNLRYLPSKEMQRIVNIYRSEATSVRIQRALWARAVITVSRGPALAVAFEGTSKDLKRRETAVPFVIFHWFR